jgi:hypothetical protein
MGKWHYPKWRRVAMQAVMFLILGASLALAQWVVHDRRTNGSTRMGGMRYYGPIGVRIPAGWKLESEAVEPGLAPKWVKFKAVEPGPGGAPGRVLLVAENQGSPRLTAEQLLNLLPEIPRKAIQIGPYTGVLVNQQIAEDTLMGPESGPEEYQLIAGCVGPTGIAIRLVLDCPIDPESDENAQRQQRLDDILLIQEIARLMIVHTEPNAPWP